MYHNELIVLSNNVLIDYNNEIKIFFPFSLLRYYFIEDQRTCRRYNAFVTNQIKLSKNITKGGVKERILFFKSKYLKIKKLRERLELIRQFSFNL